MKKLIAVILSFALLASLSSCGQKAFAPEPAQSPAQTGGQPAPSSGAPSQGAAQQPEGVVKTGEEAENWDGLNEFGLPDLSAYTEEELWDMYVHPENWDSDALELGENDLFTPDEEAYYDPEIGEEYSFDLGEWHDFDPGSWAPGPEVFYDYEDEETQSSGGEDGEDTDAQLYSELPDKYAFLLPEGLRDGDLAMEEDGTFVLNLKNRGAEDFKAMVKRAKDAGYTKDATEMDIMGISMYEAGNGSETLTVMLQSGAILVSVE